MWKLAVGAARVACRGVDDAPQGLWNYIGVIGEERDLWKPVDELSPGHSWVFGDSSTGCVQYW